MLHVADLLPRWECCSGVWGQVQGESQLRAFKAPYDGIGYD